MDNRHRFRIAVLMTATVAGCVILTQIARSDEIDAFSVYAVTMGACGFLMGLLIPLDDFTVEAGSPADRRMSHRMWVDLGLISTSLVVQCVYGSAIYSLSYGGGEEADPSWFALVAALTLLLGLLAAGIPYLMGFMIVAPIRVLARSLFAFARGRDSDGPQAWLAVLLLGVVTMAVTVVLARTDTQRRRGLWGLVRPLVGVGVDNSGVLIWIARASLVLVAYATWQIRRDQRGSERDDHIR